MSSRFPRFLIIGWLALLIGSAGFSAYGQAGTYQSTNEFLEEGFFGKGTPSAGAYALSSADQAAAKAILGHSYGASRLRYWKSGDRSAWILEEIGKTRPITTGFVVDGGKIHLVRVLIYRESHGGEVKNKFFTKQFDGAKLGSAPRYDLSRRINSISGATLSVNALRKLSRFALYLDSKVSG